MHRNGFYLLRIFQWLRSSEPKDTRRANFNITHLCFLAIEPENSEVQGHTGYPHSNLFLPLLKLSCNVQFCLYLRGRGTLNTDPQRESSMTAELRKSWRCCTCRLEPFSPKSRKGGSFQELKEAASTTCRVSRGSRVLLALDSSPLELNADLRPSNLGKKKLSFLVFCLFVF